MVNLDSKNEQTQKKEPYYMDWSKLTLEASTSYSEGNYLLPLSEYRLIVVSGKDALSFLQGQCTCDFTSLDAGAFTLGAHCSPKGRMISSFVAAKLDENTIGLRVHASIASSALETLKKYAVFSKATLEIKEDAILIGLLGENVRTLENIPSVGFQQKISGNGVYLRHSEDQAECWLLASNAAELKELKLVSHFTLREDEQLWHLHQIRRGIGEVRAETQEQLLPQEINLQLTGGVSFKKGCYTGQEIVARLHYRGQLKKHMYRGAVQTDHAPEPGHAIFDGISDAKKGMIINAVKLDDQQYELLAVCEDRLIDANLGTLDPNSHTKIQWLDLPYAIN